MGGSLEYSDLKNATDGRSHANIKNFVETGTYKGDTTLMVAKHYENVYTTEIHEGNQQLIIKLLKTI